MKVILSHPTGNANVRAVANAFAQENMLSAFYTTISCFPETFLDYLSGYHYFAEIKRRQYDPILKPYTEMLIPWMEAGRMLSTKFGFKALTKHETGVFSVNNIYREFDKAVASKLKLNKFTGVYAYEDGALHSFIKAKSLGLPRFYDLPIGYWRTARTLLEKEREKWPDWANTITGFSDSDEKLARKDQELSLATRIFVASKFTANTLDDYPGNLAPVEIIPYGFPPTVNMREYLTISKTRPLKLLFVGGLSQRKGIANLFSAVEKLKNHVELTIIGRKTNNNCPALNEALTKHRWIDGLSHDGILKTMKEHDVLLFPSLFEGFGLVITEAMSQGTPVITTNRTAGPDLIDHGHNGWLIEAGSTDALQESIEQILYSPSLIEKTGRAAMKTASERSWSLYGHELAKSLLKEQVLL
ncbi:MAG: glycosyl transferase family 1 [Mucilaginibacter sp.]|nr:glycosyl transferase family 1 [Mucilaginibacter sp.]